MRLLNYTNRQLLFVEKDNLNPRGNGRYEIGNEADLVTIHRIPVVGHALRANVRQATDELCFGLPIIQETLLGADPIPEGDDILIVSKQYAEACRRLCRPTQRLRIVCGGVYTTSLPFPVACTGLARVEACLPYVQPELFSNDQITIDEIIALIRSDQLKPEVLPGSYLREYPLTPDDCFPPTTNY